MLHWSFEDGFTLPLDQFRSSVNEVQKVILRCQNLFRVRFGLGLAGFPKFLLILAIVEADP